MRPLGDGFIKLIRMLIAPIIFTTITVGIAHMLATHGTLEVPEAPPVET
jgi:Na+/H+-dicarboxylate symporter